jgi:hypothetical protein
MSIFAIILKSSPASCCGPPVPLDAYAICAFRERASSISSLTVLTGSEGCTTSTKGVVATSVTGAKSRTVS